MAVVILVVGMGQMGSLHYRNLLKLKDEYDIQLLAGNSISNLSSIILSEKIDACVIALPYHLHYEVASMVLKNNVSCFVEKPVTSSYTTTKKLADIAEKMKKILIVGHILRFSESFEIVNKLISKNKIGKITMVNCRRFTSKNIKSWWKDLDRFLLLYEGIHTVDILIKILCEMPYCVNCRLNYLHPRIKGESEFMAILEFKSGIVASIHHNMMSSYNTNEIYISGTNGELLIRDFSKVYLNGSLIYKSSFSEMIENSSFNEMKVFLDSLIYGESPKSSIKEILPSMKVIEACYLSACNRKVVNIEEVQK